MPKKNQMRYEKHQQQMKQKQQQRLTRKQLKKQRGQARQLKGYEKHFKEFQDEMNQLGLQIRDVEGDGNCLFRSISDFLHGTEANHKQLRRLAVETMNENQDFFSVFIEDDMTFDQYLKEMTQDGEWGGNLELQALAQALEVNFFIHMKGRPCMIIQSMTDDKSLADRDSIHLAYHLIENIAEHYSSVRMLGDDKLNRAEPIPLDIFDGLMDQFKLAPLDNNEFQDYENQEQFDYLDQEEKDYLEFLKQQEEEEKRANQILQQNYQLKQKKNARCNCGSKKTYKECCMKKDIEPKQQINKPNQEEGPQKKQAVFI